MDHENLIAIDIHTHAEVSCWNHFDNYGENTTVPPTNTLARIAARRLKKRSSITVKRKLVW